MKKILKLHYDKTCFRTLTKHFHTLKTISVTPKLDVTNFFHTRDGLIREYMFLVESISSVFKNEHAAVVLTTQHF